MSDHEKTALENLVTTMESKYNQLLKVAYGLVIVILGAGAIQFVSFGEVRKELETTTFRTNEIWKDYMPTIFMEGIMKTYSLQTESIVAKIGGDQRVIERENRKFDELRSELLNNLQAMRGGMTSTTRGLKSTDKGLGGME